MAVTPMAVTFLVLSLLAMSWISVRERLARLDHSLPFHVSAYQRDRRKSRFYVTSVWMGIGAAFLGLLTLDFLASSSVEPLSLRQGLIGLGYGLGLWGVLTISMVWSQVSHRASQVNSDGQSLVPSPEERK